MRTAAPALTCILLCALALGGCSPAVRGSLALNRGDHAQALALYNEALASDPDSPYLITRIGLVYFDMADYARAEASFLAALAKAPGYPDAQLYLGLARIGKGEREAGLDLLEAYAEPLKYFHQKYVRDEARRLRNHPEYSTKEIVQSVLKALEEGQDEQLRMEREILNFPNG